MESWRKEKRCLLLPARSDFPSVFRWVRSLQQWPFSLVLALVLRAHSPRGLLYSFAFC